MGNNSEEVNLFDAEDLLFYDGDRTTGHLYGQTDGVNNRGGNPALYSFNENNSLKFDIHDSSFSIPVDSEEGLDGHLDNCIPESSSSHLDDVIDNVVQRRNWLDYDNSNFISDNGTGEYIISPNSKFYESHHDNNDDRVMYAKNEFGRTPQTTHRRVNGLHSTANEFYDEHQASFIHPSQEYYQHNEEKCLPAVDTQFAEYYGEDEEDSAFVNGEEEHDFQMLLQEPEGESHEFLPESSANISEFTTVFRHGRKGPTTKICEYCGLFLRHPSKIAAHMRTHTGERPFTCEYCGQDFSQRTPYRMHVKRHVGDLPFFCSFCGKKFPSNASRNGHEIRVHHKLRRQGVQKSRPKPSSMVRDNTEIDLGKNRSPIVNWNPPFGDLRKPISDTALRKITGIVDAVASGVPNGRRGMIGDERRFEDRHPPTVAQCTDCGLIFKHPSKIQAHMRTHTGEKPFICKVCDLGCSTNSALRVHIRRVHTGERPHECTWDCGRRFVSVAARNEHERIVHAGIKRYQCTVGNCRRLFTRRSYMVKHLQSHSIEVNSQQQDSFMRLNVPQGTQHQRKNAMADHNLLQEMANNLRLININDHYGDSNASSSKFAQHSLLGDVPESTHTAPVLRGDVVDGAGRHHDVEHYYECDGGEGGHIQQHSSVRQFMRDDMFSEDGAIEELDEVNFQDCFGGKVEDNFDYESGDDGFTQFTPINRSQQTINEML